MKPMVLFIFSYRIIEYMDCGHEPVWHFIFSNKILPWKVSPLKSYWGREKGGIISEDMKKYGGSSKRLKCEQPMPVVGTKIWDQNSK